MGQVLLWVVKYAHIQLRILQGVVGGEGGGVVLAIEWCDDGVCDEDALDGSSRDQRLAINMPEMLSSRGNRSIWRQQMLQRDRRVAGAAMTRHRAAKQPTTLSGKEGREALQAGLASHNADKCLEKVTVRLSDFSPQDDILVLHTHEYSHGS
nr:hypothetical protein L203_05411 [Cryptococcus depauperatus CBS 7841]